MAVSLFFYYCCPLNVINQEKDWAKMVQGGYATRIQSLSN